MTLTKSDLSSIREILKDETGYRFDKLEKGQKRIENKFDDLFDFLDKDLSTVKRRVSYIDHHLKIDTSNL
jgi:hypothetical protein